MKVAVLQQYLRSLLEPLRSAGASAKVVTDLERTSQEFEAFREKEVTEFADFLRRAREYEEKGHWPAAATKATAARKAKPQLDATGIRELATRLLGLRNTPELAVELNNLEGLTVAQLKDLNKNLGVPGSFKSKPDGLAKTRAFLAGPAATPEPSTSTKLARIVETLTALKAKADTPAAPFDEIEAELHSLEKQLDAREAIHVARALGVVRTVTARDDALEAIRRKVLQVKYAREIIAY